MNEVDRFVEKRGNLGSFNVRHVDPLLFDFDMGIFIVKIVEIQGLINVITVSTARMLWAPRIGPLEAAR